MTEDISVVIVIVTSFVNKKKNRKWFFLWY